MAAQILKCKCPNNADKQRKTIELYAKGLAKMAEIFLAETHADNINKHNLVIDLLTQYQQDTLSHLPINLSTIIEIYHDANHLQSPLKLKLTTPTPSLTGQRNCNITNHNTTHPCPNP